ncbi:leucine-rich repeat domain-containing protein [Alienimonas chondri]|uniref:Disease resistance R13L4/SHOC-2-like LRR domain-containing protein n=1 Tax=Alienimonas chondri TaxID=2681879 RepID=A0ABX1VJV1_9PLAN|nr:hypothetical protein [Alienimonas chondri]NNJ27740.1 hypothetical protein [Alienimonas chondri]
MTTRPAPLRPLLPRALQTPPTSLIAATLVGAALCSLTLSGCEPDAAVVKDYEDAIAERDDAIAERDALKARVAVLEADGGGADLDPLLNALRDAGATVTEDGGVVTAVAMPATSSTNAAHLLPLLLMPELKSLTVGGTSFDDAAMGVVGQLTSLERLDISGTPVSNDGLAKLSGLTNLKVLRLKTVSVNDLSPVEGMQDMRELDLRFSNVGDAAMDSVAKLPKLATLKLERSAVTDDGLSKLSADQPIKALDLDTGFSEAPAIIAEKFPDLRSLELDRSDVYGAEGFAPLGRLTELRTLSLQETYPTDEELAPTLDDADAEPVLSALTNLETLNLRQTGVTSKLMPVVGQLTNLKSLNLAEASGVREEGLKELAGLTKLEDLDLWATGATDATMQEVVANFENLKALSLQQTKVGDEGLAALADLKQLERLDLSETQITDESVAVLRGLPNLKSLTLKNTELTGEGVAELEEANPDLQITR